MMPIFLDLRDQTIVIVGAGPVARRKLTILTSQAARIRVVALEPRPEWFPETLGEWHQGEYSVEVLTGASLVIAAATPAVNAQVVADALARGIWICDAAEPDRGNVHFPATFSRRRFTLAVSTDGIAPALAARIRDKLAEDFEDHFQQWLELLAELRQVVRQRIDNARCRGELLREFSDWRWLEQLRRDGLEPVRERMIHAVESASTG